MPGLRKRSTSPSSPKRINLVRSSQNGSIAWEGRPGLVDKTNSPNFASIRPIDGLTR